MNTYVATRDAFVEDLPRVLDMLDDVAQDRDIEPAVAVGNVVPVEEPAFDEPRESPRMDRGNPGRRYLERVELLPE